MSAFRRNTDIAAGRSKLDPIRSLKRYLAREVFNLIMKRNRTSTPPESPLDKQKGVRGSQYASEVYRELLATHGLIGSMSRRGNPYDNAKDAQG